MRCQREGWAPVARLAWDIGVEAGRCFGQARNVEEEVVGSGSWASANEAWRNLSELAQIDFVGVCGPAADDQDADASSFQNGFPDTFQHAVEAG